uniref:Uncharacterized protein LOC114346588 n=1 Tax=Diabrotica virgifera virgifera TaxID=50390 RepID=A0A6P7H3M3_DIAVI
MWFKDLYKREQVFISTHKRHNVLKQVPKCFLLLCSIRATQERRTVICTSNTLTGTLENEQAPSEAKQGPELPASPEWEKAIEECMDLLDDDVFLYDIERVEAEYVPREQTQKTVHARTADTDDDDEPQTKKRKRE